MSIQIKANIKPFDILKKRTLAEFAKIPPAALDYFVKETPVRSGNARRNTQLQGTEIQANYDYAERLNTGSSRQAPQGMTDPTERYIDRVLVPQAVRRINRGQ
jgi:hypothetical protein